MNRYVDEPLVSFRTPGTPAQSGPLAVTSTASLRHSDLGGGPLSEWGNCPETCNWVDGDDSTSEPGTLSGDAGYASVQRWGSCGLQVGCDSTQSALRVRPAGPAPTDVGQPFRLTFMAHYNIPIRFSSPTDIPMQTTVTVEPPVGEPVTFRLLGNESIWLDFLETDNTPPCNPAIQETDQPCDDLLALHRETTSTVTGNGVTWHLEVLGWRLPDGGFVRRITSREGGTRHAELYAQVTVDTNPTTSVLTVDDSTPGLPVLTLATAPVPQTGGTVTFTEGGAPIEGCTDVPVDAVDGTTTCSPAGPRFGLRTFGGAFAGGVGYSPSTAEPVQIAGVAPQVVLFEGPDGLTYGDDAVALEASATSGLPVAFTSSTPDVCATEGSQLHLLGAGSCTVVAAQAGNEVFAAAEQSRTFEVAPALLTVTADDQSRAAGEPNPELTFSTTGFVGGDTPAVVSGVPVLSTTATPGSPPGEYPITVDVTGLSAEDYELQGQSGTLSVRPAPAPTPPSAPGPGTPSTGATPGGAGGPSAVSGGSGASTGGDLPVTGGSVGATVLLSLLLCSLGAALRSAGRREASGRLPGQGSPQNGPRRPTRST